jgi:ferric-dicitrate binding protein FerR (iron transport regulator)
LAVELNTDSHVRLTFTSGRRAAHLVRGEALFEVEYNEQPFDVISQCGRMRALNTTFAVYARPNGRCDLVVENGRVRTWTRNAHRRDLPHRAGRRSGLASGLPCRVRQPAMRELRVHAPLEMPRQIFCTIASYRSHIA